MQKHGMTVALLFSALLLSCSIIATVHGVYPFGEVRPWSNRAVVVAGDYLAKQDHDAQGSMRREQLGIPSYFRPGD